MTRGKEILVGLVIVAGVAAAVLGTLWLQDASFGRGTLEVDALLLEDLENLPYHYGGVPILPCTAVDTQHFHESVPTNLD